jgi:large subunit ribosomal protein L15
MRVGRGNAAGKGTYSGRGLKGQKSRAGNKPRRFFEGGQTRMMKRLPKRRGFTNLFRVEYQALNLTELQAFDAGTNVTPELLKEKRILRSTSKPIKLLATGEIDRALTVTVHRASQAAKDKVAAAGGVVVETSPRPEPKPKKEKKKKKGNQDKAKAEKPATSEPEAVTEPEPAADAEAEPEAE